mmetsp:Transcript_28533/g.89382  ORF Transcript_28533/g.89382 Transcript_28533/m.89382 type:complete len:532 (+) Transcript_28533:219-1814(+)
MSCGKRRSSSASSPLCRTRRASLAHCHRRRRRPTPPGSASRASASSMLVGSWAALSAPTYAPGVACFPPRGARHSTRVASTLSLMTRCSALGSVILSDASKLARYGIVAFFHCLSLFWIASSMHGASRAFAAAGVLADVCCGSGASPRSMGIQLAWNPTVGGQCFCGSARCSVVTSRHGNRSSVYSVPHAGQRKTAERPAVPSLSSSCSTSFARSSTSSGACRMTAWPSMPTAASTCAKVRFNRALSSLRLACGDAGEAAASWRNSLALGSGTSLAPSIGRPFIKPVTSCASRSSAALRTGSLPQYPRGLGGFHWACCRSTCAALAASSASRAAAGHDAVRACSARSALPFLIASRSAGHFNSGCLSGKIVPWSGASGVSSKRVPSWSTWSHASTTAQRKSRRPRSVSSAAEPPPPPPTMERDASAAAQLAVGSGCCGLQSSVSGFAFFLGGLGRAGAPQPSWTSSTCSSPSLPSSLPSSLLLPSLPSTPAPPAVPSPRPVAGPLPAPAAEPSPASLAAAAWSLLLVASAT